MADAPRRPGPGIPLGLLPALFTLTVLFGGAVFGIVASSLRPGALAGAEFGFGGWRDLVHDDAFAASLRFTLAFAAAATAISAIGALALAAGLHGRARWLRAAVASAVPLPHLVAASLAMFWFAPGGIAERLIGSLPFDVVGDRRGLGIVAVYVFKELPFLTLLVLAAWDRATIDATEAAAALGAGRFRRFADIVVPRVAPTLAAGALIVAAFTVGATEVPLVVGPTEPDALAPYAINVVRTEGPAARAWSNAALVTTSALALALGAGAAVAVNRRSAARPPAAASAR